MLVRKASKYVRGPVFYPLLSNITDIFQTASHLARHTQAPAALQLGHWQRSTRRLATSSGSQYDAVIIGGGACQF